MEASGNVHDAHVELLDDDVTHVKITGKDLLKSKYSVEYLKKIIKAGKLANKVVLQFGENYPLRLDYMVKDKLCLNVLLAPRVATD